MTSGANNKTPRAIPSGLTECGFTLGIFDGLEALLPPVCAVPAGEFLMGRNAERDLPDRKGYEPEHTVWVEAYAIGRYPVTVAEYHCFVDAGGEASATYGWSADWQSQLQRPEHPVVRVTWDQATAYARWLAGLTGQPWRLPTEAEWEKAARWDDSKRQARVYPWGDTYDRLRANTSNHGPGKTTPVGRYPRGQSPYGALDMAGNVFEWCSSYYLPYPYNTQDGRESPQAGLPHAYYRIRRGGAWDRTWHDARCAHRNFDIPSLNSDAQGFRLACGAAPVSPASPGC
jgi:formylglycine-generating enzyme required for sulfatase activity